MKLLAHCVSCATVAHLLVVAAVSGQTVLFSEPFPNAADSTSAFLSLYSPPWIEDSNLLNNQIIVRTPTVPFLQTFDTLAAGTTAFIAAYSPPWFLDPDRDDPNDVSVIDRDGRRMLAIKEIVQGTSTRKTVVVGGYNVTAFPQLLIEMDVGAPTNSGWYEVGMDIADIYINFAPGYAAEGGRGWFKINNNWGTGDVAGTDMGFVPANGTMHHMKVLWNQPAGEFDITITDGDNPANVFHYFWTHPTAVGAAGRPLGVYRGGSHDHIAGSDGLGLYDDFKITPQSTDSTGQLNIKEVFDENTYTSVSVPGYDASAHPELFVEGDVGATSSGGRYNVGLNLGSVLFEFTPGKGSFPRGAFRINNQWGGGDVSDTDMGFVPANQAMHHMSVHWKQAQGQFEVTIADGGNPANVFNYSWSHASATAAAGGRVGFVRDGLDDGSANTDGLGVYDNLKITSVPPLCPRTVFADADGDGDVDMDDFGVFQLCFGITGGTFPTDPPHCACFDREPDDDVDATDFTEFAACATGAAIVLNTASPPPGCNP